ncbi:unnamed protein product [Miscanthus lutarioriparius]|uniref:MATH domain-containing protein n=1 Tax=Miscanthus lutarioriparius TaxID=422564 RepID=A0A811R3T1_9POAL|nr:unnamed protein product [Miscanthus lutarioriparius]
MTLEKLPCDDGDGGGKRRTLGLAVGVPVGVVAVVGAAVLAYVCVVERRKVHGDDGNSSSAITGTMIRSLAGGPREFEYREISKATNNFDEKMKLGQGGLSLVPVYAVSKRRRLAGLEGQTIDSAVHECRVDYEQIKHGDIGMPVHSDVFSAGGHMWRINFYPCGEDESDQANYRQLIILIELVSASSGGVNAMFEAFLLHRDGQPRPVAARTSYIQSGLHLFQSDYRECMMHKILQTDLEREYVTDGYLTFLCVVMVVCDRSIHVPASDIGKHFGSLLDSSDGTDVSFVIGTETFHAH